MARKTYSAVRKPSRQKTARFIFHLLVGYAISGCGATSHYEALTIGTYVAFKYGRDSFIVAADSRSASDDLSIVSDETCKIFPFSHHFVFIGLALTGIKQIDDKFVEISEIAKEAYEESNSENPSIVAQKWESIIKTTLSKTSDSYKVQFLSHMRHGNNTISQGVFAGIEKDREILVVIATVHVNDDGGGNITFSYDRQELDPDLYSIGYDALYKEFRNNVTERAREANRNVVTTPVANLAHVAIWLRELVAFVSKWSADGKVGGDPAILILEKDIGIRWFRRPDFCPEK